MKVTKMRKIYIKPEMIINKIEYEDIMLKSGINDNGILNWNDGNDTEIWGN